jgi:hypothetical protein
MHTTSRILALLLLLAGLSGCIYSSATVPLDRNVEETTIGSKQGRASVYIVAWLVAWGDAGVEAAAENGGLKVIHHLDTERRVILFGLFTRLTTIAYGD